MKYRITLKNQLKVLNFSIFVLFFLIALQIHHIYTSYDYINPVIIGWAVINFVPVFYLHIEYYYFNKGMRLEVYSYKKMLIYTDKSGKTETYNFNELSKIIVYMSPNMYSGRNFKIAPFESYHYAKIITKDVREIIITCLLVPRLREFASNLIGVEVEKKRRIFSSVLLEQVL